MLERDAARVLETQQELQRTARQARQGRQLLQQLDPAADAPAPLAVASSASSAVIDKSVLRADMTVRLSAEEEGDEGREKENASRPAAPLGVLRRPGQFVPM